MMLLPDPGYAAFVAKTQKVKTRKGKDYFVYRVTIPKDKAEQIGVKPDDYLLFRAKRAQWYHMINWDEMEQTWQMLPDEIRRDVVLSGLPSPGSASFAGLLQGGQAFGSFPSAPTSAIVPEERAMPQITVEGR
jgi:hypothetical protein